MITTLRFACVLAVLSLLAACGPPSRVDTLNYEAFKRVRPVAFATAPIVMSWRGFTKREVDSSHEQCGVLVYDLKGQPVAPFLARIEQAPDWLIVEDLGKSAAGWTRTGLPPNPDRDRWEQITLAPDFRLFDGAKSFCDMPAGEFATFSTEVSRLMKTPSVPVFARNFHYDGGAGMSGPRKDIYFNAVIDEKTQRLYTWFQVDVSVGLF